jgi:pimeloyl-ACP methyl ester carboxylesterase
VIRAFGTAGLVLFVLAVSVPASARPGETGVQGPFGVGADQVWLLRPHGKIQHVVVFGHGWKNAPPSAMHPWVGQFRPWLEHLVRHGNAVLFPRYQLGTGDSQGPERATAYRKGLEIGFARLGAPGVPVIAVGYSFGASLAYAYAANAHRWRLPEPSALDCVFPAGPVAGLPRIQMPDAVRVLIQVGDRDTEAGAGGANEFWALLRSHPDTRKRYSVVRSSSGFIADHAAPKRSNTAAAGAFWAPLDALIAATQR